MASIRSQLIHAAFPLIKQHGFTREALARSVLSLPESRAEPLTEPAVSALFGEGDTARRTLINAWLDEGRAHMKAQPASTVSDALKTRLAYNEPVLGYLPEAFALLVSPRSGIPPLDVRPVIRHAATIADEACFVVRDVSIGPAWYTKRAALASIYAAAELHQIGSPETAPAFLDTLMNSAESLQSTIAEAELFTHYFVRSWTSIAKSSVGGTKIDQAGASTFVRGPFCVHAFRL